MELARSTAWALASNEAAASQTDILTVLPPRLRILVDVMNHQTMSCSEVTVEDLVLLLL